MRQQMLSVIWFLPFGGDSDMKIPLMTILTQAFSSSTGHNSNKPTAKWNPVSAKGLDERGFL